jgi:hypothetical protein
MNISLEKLRSYRIDLEQYPFFNTKSQGIALFDLISSFIVAFLLEKYLVNSINSRNKRLIYYLLVIPFGIVIHHIIAHYNSGWKLFPEEITFLNKKLFSTEINIYKFLILILLYFIYTLW